MNYQAGNGSMFATAAREEVKAPDFVLALLKSSSDGKTAEVISIKYGERGYYKTTWGRQTQEWVDERNISIGIDKATAMAFECCSLFGSWGNYEKIKSNMKAKTIHVGLPSSKICTCCDPVHPGDNDRCPVHGVK